GKPPVIGGSLSRIEATGRGALYCIHEAIRKQGRGFAGLRVAVQGFGNVGASLAKLLTEEGARVIAVSDTSGAFFNPQGIDVRAAILHKQEAGQLAGLRNAEATGNDELLTLECDVL